MRSLLVFLLLLLRAAAAFSDSSPVRWENIGPEGGYVRKLVPDRKHPGIWFCVASFQIYRSKDNGIHWTAVLSQAKQLDLAVQTSTSTVYAWNQDIIWRSTDTGRTFQPLCTHDCADSISPHPSDPDFLIGTVSNGLPQMVVSTNGGATWHPVSGPRTLQGHNRSVGLFGGFFLPFDPETIYVSAFFQREGSDESHSVLLVTKDRCRSWTIFNHEHSFSFAADPGYPDRAFAFHEGIYRIDSSGWKKISNQEVASYGSFVSVLHSPDEFYYQLLDKMLHSTDGGTHWSPAFTDLRIPRRNGLASVDDGEHTLLLATDLGVFRRTNGSWADSSQGLHEFLPIGSVSRSGSVLFVTASSVLFQKLPEQRWSIRFFDRDVAVFPDPFRSNHWFQYVRSLRETTDGGNTWKDTSRHDDVWFDPGLRDHLFFFHDDVWQETFDGGKTIKTLPFSMRNVIQFFVEGQAHNIFYFFTTFGVYRTDDGGKTLRRADFGLKIRELQDSIQLGPPGHFLALCGKDILKTEDAGNHWTRLAVVPPGVTVFTFAVSDDQGRHLLALSKKHLLESLDAGKDWTDITPALGGAGLQQILDPRQFPLTIASTRGLFRRIQ